jgi:ABC-type polysaccharide/polyol phosphate transport system ATPase subunit
VTGVSIPHRSPVEGLRAEDWLLSLEAVSKEYPPPAPMRLRRWFSRLGGLHVEGGFGANALSGQIDDDEDELEDDLARDDDLLPQPEAILGHRVVDNVSLRAHGGAVVGLVGPPGAGKTMLLKLIGGLVPPSDGRVVVRGSVAPALNDMSLILPTRAHTVRAALPQLGGMVGIPPHVVRSRFERIADMLELPGLLKSSTSLMESRRKRELVLAMALSVDPDVLLIDIKIATDDAFGDRCVQRIDELRGRGALVIVEARSPSAVPVALDRVISVEGGRIA